MKKAKEFILGALVGSMVMGGCVTAFGSSGAKTIQAVYKNIKVVIDGKELKTDKEPFTYEGTTYLPVRSVAEAVGKEVKWDSATQTVILGEDLREIAPVAKTTKEEFYGISYEVPESWGDPVNNQKSKYYYPSGAMVMVQYSGMNITSSDLRNSDAINGLAEGISQSANGFKILDIKYDKINGVDTTTLTVTGSVTSGEKTANLEKIVLINSQQGLITAIYSNFGEKSKSKSDEFDKTMSSLSFIATQSKPSSTASVAPKASTGSKTVNNSPKISKAEFDKLTAGMTYKEVISIIGGRGVLGSEVGSAGDEYHTVVYVWDGEGSIGANANIIFQNDKLYSKAQAGLK